MPAALDPTDPVAAGVVAAGVLARMAGVVAVGGLPILSAVSLPVRLAVVAAVSLVALPAALAALPTGAVPPPLPPVVVGEAIVGAGMGTAVAMLIGAAGWAGGILGTVSGLSWADDFDPAGPGENAGIGRLAWWVGLGAFVAGGGQAGLVAGLVDGMRTIPIGTAFSSDAPLPALLVAMLGVATSLALTLAVPALAAVLAFHLAAAICLRMIPFAAGAGLLQAAASLVLLAAVYLGAEVWADGFGRMVTAPIEACVEGR